MCAFCKLGEKGGSEGATSVGQPARPEGSGERQATNEAACARSVRLLLTICPDQHATTTRIEGERPPVSFRGRSALPDAARRSSCSGRLSVGDPLTRTKERPVNILRPARERLEHRAGSEAPVDLVEVGGVRARSRASRAQEKARQVVYEGLAALCFPFHSIDSSGSWSRHESAAVHSPALSCFS